MYKELSQVWRILNNKQRKKVKYLQVFVILISFLEIATVALVAGFMHVINNANDLSNVPYLMFISENLKFSSNEMILLISIFVVLILTGSSIFSIWLTKSINYSAFSIGKEISVRLFQFYQDQDWIFHTQVNSSRLINRTLTETNRLTTSVLLPLLLLVSKIVLIFLITLTLLIYNPIVSIGGALLCIVGYYILFVFSKSKLSNNSLQISSSNQLRIKCLNEGFEGVKQVILSDKSSFYVKKYELACESMANAQSSTVTLSAAPRYMMEWLAYVGVISLLLFFIHIQGNNTEEIIPILTLYGVSIFKLLPAMQQAYSNLATVKGNLSVVGELSDDIVSSNKSKTSDRSDLTLMVPFVNSLKTNDLYFKYPNKDLNAISGMSIEIKKNSCVGFVGPSGSGKSTLIDIISGLISPNLGSLLVDGKDISNDLAIWRRNIAYVPQTNILTDGTILENIAFGIPKSEINLKMAFKAVEQAHLTNLISSLEEGLETVIGERGVQLSGGQRQRISIARALYTGADVLIFDEATSALDGITEKLIMDAIINLSGIKTILLIAHRLKTVETCDNIYFIEDGKVIDSGSYMELLKNNSQFSKMVSHS